jgi:hypothetical protein
MCQPKKRKGEARRHQQMQILRNVLRKSIGIPKTMARHLSDAFGKNLNRMPPFLEPLDKLLGMQLQTTGIGGEVFNTDPDFQFEEWFKRLILRTAFLNFPFQSFRFSKIQLFHSSTA